MVHHAGKNPERTGADSILGSQAFFAAVDTAIIIKRNKGVRTISTEQRYGPSMPEALIELDQTSRKPTLGRNLELTQAESIEERILAFLEQPIILSATEAQILEGTTGAKKLKVPALRKLVSAGRVIREGKGGPKNPFQYSIAADGNDVPVSVPVLDINQEQGTRDEFKDNDGFDWSKGE